MACAQQGTWRNASALRRLNLQSKCRKRQSFNRLNAMNDTIVSAFSGPSSYDDREAIYRLVSHSLQALNLPLGFISTGQKIVLKPNWVKEHDERYPGPDQWEHVVTHPAVIEAVAAWA